MAVLHNSRSCLVKSVVLTGLSETSWPKRYQAIDREISRPMWHLVICACCGFALISVFPWEDEPTGRQNILFNSLDDNPDLCTQNISFNHGCLIKLPHHARFAHAGVGWKWLYVGQCMMCAKDLMADWKPALLRWSRFGTWGSEDG